MKLQEWRVNESTYRKTRIQVPRGLGAEVFEEEDEELGTKVALYPHYAHTNFILYRVE